ncbi:MAG: helix-turn-helix transcriptional regulator [Nocardioidaceae bacterium]
MTAQKAERLMNLTICLLVARTNIPKDRIRQAVEGYHGLTDEAFDRMFDRDKDELRVLGVPIEVGPVTRGFDDQVGYRIHRHKFELPEISLEADEAAVIGLAARVWQHARLASATWQGLRKLKAAGVDVDESAMAILEPQLVSAEPAFDAVLEAVTSRTPVGFDYRASGAVEHTTRSFEPWGIASWHGHWYVVGHDRDREAPRMFRVSRIVGDVRPLGPAGSYSPPAELDVRALVASLAPERPHSTATVLVRVDRGGSLRRRATAAEPTPDGEWTRIEVPYASGSSLAEELVSFGPDVVVTAPEEVRQSVVRRLVALSGSGQRS